MATDPTLSTDPAPPSRRTPRGAATRWAIQASIETLAQVGRALPNGRRHLARVSVTHDVSYGPLDDHRLDVYRPAGSTERLPVMLYVHGGGFAFCSRQTHWSIAARYARMGFVVFNIDYRLAPAHRFPAAFDDAARALAFVLGQAPAHGGDPARLVLAGESAGGNLVTALTAATTHRLDHGPARELFELAPTLSAVLPACGVLQVTDVERFKRNKPHLPDSIARQLVAMRRSYLGRGAHPVDRLYLADPLRLLEDRAPDRPLPPAFVLVGTRDFLLDDSRRLHAALTARGARSELRIYPGEIHAFHALPWRDAARDCWREQRAFLASLGLVEPG
jgi:acetyl esterase